MLRLHRSERADLLADSLGDLLLDPPADPMAPEVVAVPTRGVERWLCQTLSQRLGARDGRDDGVCANVDFPFPGRLVEKAAATACGVDRHLDPWRPERSVWPLMQVVDTHLGDPRLAPLAAHLGAASPGGSGDDGVRRFATIRHLADLFDRYSVHRPQMVIAWADGANGAGEAGASGELEWQAELWRMLRDRLGAPSPAERLETAAARLAEAPDLLDLPERISLFGLTRLPASHLRVLEAISCARDLHLFLLHPSDALWEKVASSPLARPGPLPCRDDTNAVVPANTLLRSWGRDAREMQLTLAAQGITGGEHRAPEAHTTLLGLVQAAVRADEPPPGPPSAGEADRRPLLDPYDDSLRVHSCHGRKRQVEVVRDAVLNLLADHESLEPRDVVVMCPDIESFAPLIHAAFGVRDAGDSRAGDGAPGSGPGAATGPPELKVRLADRSIHQTNPLLALAAYLLELAGSRLTASQVLDLASRDPVRRRFRFDDDELAQIRSWIVDSGIRWGLDGPHRESWRLGGVRSNTWAAGLDRLSLGVAMADEGQRLFRDVLPLDGVPNRSVGLAGRLTELVDRLAGALDALRGPQPAREWAAALARSTEALAEAPPAGAWQHDQLHRLLDEVEDEAGADDEEATAPLELAEVKVLLAQRLRGVPTRANFRTGDLTFCTLVPMRSVPHRVVCLLGLDDGVFPRASERDGDDLLLADPLVGDRDPRSEDCQLLLDALLAATEHLVIAFCGRDERTNQERPPAVPVAELLDVVDRTVRTSGPDRKAREQVVVCHPLQSFDVRNFTPGTFLGARGPWSFDPVDLEGARALTAQGVVNQPFLTGQLGPCQADLVQLEALVRFVKSPVRSFLRERLGLFEHDRSEQIDDALPIELDALEEWGVGDRLLEARLGGAGSDLAQAVERARGSLPPAPLDASVLHEIVPRVDALVAAAEGLPCAALDARSLEVNVALPDGRTLIGTVAGVRGDTILSVSYSRLGPRHRMAAWVRFLALTASRPDLQVSAVTMGRQPTNKAGDPPVCISELHCLGETPDTRRQVALGALAVLVDLYDRGMREPLPIYCKTSAAWAVARRHGTDPDHVARGEWETSWGHGGEGNDSDHLLVLGGQVSFAELYSQKPASDESGEGWAEDEVSRFGRLARRLWDPLLDREQITRA